MFECSSCRDCSCPCVCGARKGPASLPAELVKSLQLALARFIFSAGVAFRIVENCRFRAFIRMMCPAFVFPARDRVSSVLMTTVHEEEKALVIAELERPPHLSLATDTWRNRSGESTINYMLVSPVTKPVLWIPYTTGGVQHTANYLVSRTLTVIDVVESVLGSGKVAAALCDNASTMKSMLRKIEDEKRLVFGIGCAAHATNLLLEDVFKLECFKLVLAKCVAVTNYVNGRVGMLDTFRSWQERVNPDRNWVLTLPVRTRWYSAGSCVR